MSPRSAPAAAANRPRPTSASPSPPRPSGASRVSVSSPWHCWSCSAQWRALAGGKLVATDGNVIEAPVIQARGLLKLYGATRAVDAIDLSVRRGEIFGLLGP